MNRVLRNILEAIILIIITTILSIMFFGNKPQMIGYFIAGFVIFYAYTIRKLIFKEDIKK